MKSIPSLALVLGLAAGALPAAARPSAAAGCVTGLTLSLQPGLPTSMRRVPQRVAPDIPRGPFSVAVPLYPGARALTRFVGSPVASFPATPYLQTAVAEYRTADEPPTVTAWYRAAFAACGWRVQGTMATNVGVLSSGITFASRVDADRTVEMTFGSPPTGGSYIGYAAEVITYPPRPPSSYLRGPFSEVRIALNRTAYATSGRVARHVDHVTMTDRARIARLVTTVNAVTEYFTVPTVCVGGFTPIGPMWLSFVRPNGSIAHAYETLPGACGGLAVNGVRWLIDRGAVYYTVVARVRQHEAVPLALPFGRTWRGPGLSPWFRLRAGGYDFEARYRPLGCATDIALVGANGYHVADIRNWAPHVPRFKGGARWTGRRVHLVAGVYRIEGRQVAGSCVWSVRLRR